MKARGYCLESRSDRSRGGRIRSGGSETVVVVVTVVTVCWVAGPKDNWVMVEFDGIEESLEITVV